MNTENKRVEDAIKSAMQQEKIRCIMAYAIGKPVSEVREMAQDFFRSMFDDAEVSTLLAGKVLDSISLEDVQDAKEIIKIYYHEIH